MSATATILGKLILGDLHIFMICFVVNNFMFSYRKSNYHFYKPLYPLIFPIEMCFCSHLGKTYFKSIFLQHTVVMFCFCFLPFHFVASNTIMQYAIRLAGKSPVIQESLPSMSHLEFSWQSLFPEGGGPKV